MCREYCDQTANAIFIDVDHLLQPDEFADSDHFTRTGYYRIAQFVNDETDRIAKATANSDQQQQLPEAEAANA
jgi:NADPH-dependent 7-cyano-7-deazaguanine reductase QueF